MNCEHQRLYPILIFLYCLILEQYFVEHDFAVLQVDADYKLQDMKKAYKELEIKGKGYRRKLDDLHVSLSKHMEQ